jgi:plasmid maintenance system antidote protein VapI
MEDRGFRIRVQYPVLDVYRYLTIDESGWKTTSRFEARIFTTKIACDIAIKAFRETPDFASIPDITCEVEPVPEFDPDWVTKPGSHVKEYIDEGHITLEAFLAKTGFTEAFLTELYEGRAVLTEHVAEKLEAALRAQKSYWLRLEELYREGLRKGLRVS